MEATIDIRWSDEVSERERRPHHKPGIALDADFTDDADFDFAIGFERAQTMVGKRDGEGNVKGSCFARNGAGKRVRRSGRITIAVPILLNGSDCDL
jgi:hypothetical protein